MKPKPIPRQELLAYIFVDNSIRIECYSADADEFAKTCAEFGRFYPHYKDQRIYDLYVNENFNKDEVLDYILSYNDL